MFDLNDARRRSLLLGVVMVCGGVGCLIAVFAGKASYGRLLAKLGGLLLVYGVIRIRQVVNGQDAPAQPLSIQKASGGGRAQARVALQQLFQPSTRPLWSWHGCCLVISRLGIAVMALSLLSLLFSIALLQGRRTVVLIGVPDLASGYVMLAALAFSMLVGISLASLAGGKGFALAGHAATFAAVSLSLMMVPIVITTDQLAQAAIFSGPTTTSIRTYRVQSVRENSGKHGLTYSAEINPYHCVECRTPMVSIDKAAYDRISAAIVDAPVNPDYTWDWRGKTTNLCMTFTVEKAGAAERLLLAHAVAYSNADLQACPPDAP